VIVVEFMGQRVQELDAQGRFVRFIDGGADALAHVQVRDQRLSRDSLPMSREATPGNRNGLFRFPSDAVTDAAGTLYVSNTHAYEILVFDADGRLRAAWGGKGAEPRQWEVPVGMAVDSTGDLFVADSANFRIQGIDPEGRVFLLTRADERWFHTTRRIYSPTDVAIDARGRLVVVDFAASRIERFRIVR